MADMTGAVVENILSVEKGELPVGCLNPAAARRGSDELTNC
jgi:hypothetical protein